MHGAKVIVQYAVVLRDKLVPIWYGDVSRKALRKGCILSQKLCLFLVSQCCLSNVVAAVLFNTFFRCWQSMIPFSSLNTDIFAVAQN